MRMNRKKYFSSTTKRIYKIIVHLIKSKLLNSICFIKFFQCHLVKQRCITFYKVFYVYTFERNKFENVRMSSSELLNC